MTIKVNTSILKEWMKWQKKEHIPEIMCTGLFEKCKFFRLLDQDDTEGPTFVIQYYTAERKNYDQYIHAYAPALIGKAKKKWGEEFFIFCSLMEAVQ